MNHPLRLIQSFTRRDGRITPNQKQAFETLWTNYGVNLTEASLDLPALFSTESLDLPDLFSTSGGEIKASEFLTNGEEIKSTEVASGAKKRILEIGFGMGHSLLAMAEQFPQYQFLGVEVYRPGIGSVLNAIHKKQLKNIRLICGDVVPVLQRIPPHVLDAILIFFPDPWPKKRHHKRRLIQSSFIELISQTLKIGGYLHIATDWQNYAEQIKAVLEGYPQLTDASVNEAVVMPRITTKFEQRGQKLGHDIFEFVRVLTVS